MWYDEDDLHFRDTYDVEYSIGFGKLVCFRYTGNEIEAQSIWMDQIGLVEPFSKNKTLPCWVCGTRCWPAITTFAN